MRSVLIVGAVMAFIVGLLGFVSYRSDIQLIVGLVGLFSGLIMLGQAAILRRLS